jgi:hypothetical protein
MKRFGVATITVLLAGGVTVAACSNTADDCLDTGGARGCEPSATTAGNGGTGGSGAAGPGGSGGSTVCGDCSPPTPVCDETSRMCVACLDHDDCTDADAAQCDAGACVPCTDSAQCTHLTGTGVCDEGSCVECTAAMDAACTGSNTCDLVAKECVNVAPGSVQNCRACTNDEQCASGHRCIAMDFDGSPHGYYCLALPAPGCANPFTAPINKPSINGAASTGYCGVNEDLTTCEAALALFNDWRCTGTDGMCGPFMQAEVAVPGALCRQVGLNPNRCTYACAGAADCLASGAGSSCGGSPMPTWCGG